MKMNIPEIDVIRFDATDVIATSGGGHKIMQGVSTMSYTLIPDEGVAGFLGRENENPKYFASFVTSTYDSDGSPIDLLTLADRLGDLDEVWFHVSNEGHPEDSAVARFAQYCNDPTHRFGN